LSILSPVVAPVWPDADGFIPSDIKLDLDL